MRNTTDTFSFDIPDGWETFVEGRQFVAEGPDNEVFMLSSWAPMPHAGSRPDPAVFEKLLDVLVNNAKNSAIEGADQSTLKIIQPLSSGAHAGGLFPCWTLLAENEEVFFGEAVIRGPSAVMLATYEAPPSVERRRQFHEFLNSFGPPIARG